MRLRYKLPLISAILLAAYLSITAALAVICYPRPDVDVKESFARKMDIPGIARAGKINENLYRGGVPRGEGFEALKKLGIKTVIDLHGFRKDPDYWNAIESLGLKYFSLLLKEEPPSEEMVEEFISIVNNPDNHPVFYHCSRGKIRTGVMLAAFRMRCEGWTNEDAFDEMQYFGFNTFHRETFFFGSCAVHTELAEFVRNYKPPAQEPQEDNGPADK